MTDKLMTITSIALVLMIALTLSVVIIFGTTLGRDTGNEGYYVFCYFTGNKPEEERVCIAVSDDGYNFKPINQGKPLITQTLGTGCARDPYIFKANGRYYIIATDMKSELGWNENHSMVIWESLDMVIWYNERIIDIRDIPGYEKTCRTWAPQVIYDEAEGKYMVYWSHCLSDPWGTYLVYAYLNDDFTSIGEIKTLYRPTSGKDAIDGDIVFENNTYYLYYKDEEKSKICYVYSNKLTGPYVEPEKNKVSKSLKDVEGNCMYRIKGTDTYVMIMDEYSNGHYYIQATTKDSMTKFKKVRSTSYSFKFSPRHGSILEVGKDAYQTLIDYDTSVGMWN